MVLLQIVARSATICRHDENQDDWLDVHGGERVEHHEATQGKILSRFGLFNAFEIQNPCVGRRRDPGALETLGVARRIRTGHAAHTAEHQRSEFQPLRASNG